MKKIHTMPMNVIRNGLENVRMNSIVGKKAGNGMLTRRKGGYTLSVHSFVFANVDSCSGHIQEPSAI